MSDRTQQIHRRALAGTTPAVGVGFAITPNTVGHWRILSMAFTFTTSAVVANRRVRLAMTDGTVTTWRASAFADQAATLAVVHELYPLAVAGAVNDGLTLIPTPPDGLWLPKGWTLNVTAGAIDIGDQFSAISLDIQEMPDGPDYFTEPSMTLNTVPLDQ